MFFEKARWLQQSLTYVAGVRGLEVIRLDVNCANIDPLEITKRLRVFGLDDRWEVLSNVSGQPTHTVVCPLFHRQSYNSQETQYASCPCQMLASNSVASGYLTSSVQPRGLEV